MDDQPKQTPVQPGQHERREKSASGTALGTFTESGGARQTSNREIDVQRPVRDEIPPPPKPTPDKGED